MLILGLSSQDATASADLSRGITTQIVEKIVTCIAPVVEQQNMVTIMHGYIRDLAHIAMYFVLGILSALLCRQYPVKRQILVVFLVCAVFSVLDEINQEFFTVGRTFQMIDLYKDWFGILVAAILVSPKSLQWTKSFIRR